MMASVHVGRLEKAVVAMVAVVLVVLGSHRAEAQIAGTAHDFSTKGWSGGQICKPCHTPHNANATVTVPLWNHQVSTATYTVYTSQWLKGTPGQPGDMSKACLSCHDGTVALDSFGGASGSTFMTGLPNLTTDLSNDHPVGMRWQHQTLAAGTNCLRCHDMHNPTWEPIIHFYGSAGSKKVECVSCHTPHGKTGVPKLLKMSNAASAICLFCHDK